MTTKFLCFASVAMIVSAAFTGCSDAKKATDDSDSSVEITTSKVQIADSISVGHCTALVKIDGEYPYNGPAVADSVRNWITGLLSIDPTGSSSTIFDPIAQETANAQAIADITATSLLDNAAKDFAEFEKDGFSTGYEYDISFGPQYQTDKLLTYSFTEYSFTGGAHGSTSFILQTFDKANGKALTAAEIFELSKITEVIQLVKQGLTEQYFSEELKNGYTLADLLLIDPDSLALPAQSPSFVKDGIDFVYQQYEIAPYAAGMPTCVIPYPVIRPYLTEKATALLE